MDSCARQQERIIALGASVRFVCMSLRKAGWSCVGVDLFADRETSLAGHALSASDYPDGLFQQLSDLRLRDEGQTNFWIYTGGLENYGDRFRMAPSSIGLLGNDAECLAAIRCPFQLRDALSASGVAMPEMSRNRPGENGMKWLCKPFDSCGGLGIKLANPQGNPSSPGHYFQQYLQGDVLGAVYVAANGRSQLLGVTKSLGQPEWTGAPRFQYAGSIGPTPVTDPELTQIAKIGQALASAFPLVGVFGVDLIRSATVGLVVLEVNPRIPSSSELIERATGLSIAELHVLACRDGRLPTLEEIAPTVSSQKREQTPTTHGKAIVYAPRLIRCTTALRAAAATDLAAAAAHWFADTPTNSARISAGSPIATVFASASSEGEVLAKLQSCSNRLRQLCD